MKEKIIVGIICLLVLTGAIFSAIIISNNKNNSEQEKVTKISESPVTDECTEEYELIAKQEEVREVSSGDEKISSNSALILKKYYKACGHTINEYAEMLPELVNMTQDEVDDKFIEWELIGFSSREVTLFKEFEGTCGEHFRLREENGNVIVYRILEDKSEQIYEKTEISTEFLPETDLIKIQSKKGIEVFGIEELNKVLEDFE